MKNYFTFRCFAPQGYRCLKQRMGKVYFLDEAEINVGLGCTRRCQMSPLRACRLQERPLLSSSALLQDTLQRRAHQRASQKCSSNGSAMFVRDLVFPSDFCIRINPKYSSTGYLRRYSNLIAQIWLSQVSGGEKINTQMVCKCQPGTSL